MIRTNIINKLASEINAQTYLEIGVRDHHLNFDKINIANKISVDPHVHDREPSYKMTSDDFFKQNKDTFDIIFIDGLHESEYVERDINNSLKVLNDNGFIICHDMNPTSKEMQIVPPIQNTWTGDCWKAWVRTRSLNPNVKMFVVNTDCGCGVIQKGAQQLLDTKGLELTYENLNSNREEWLNLISVDDFLKAQL
ncbi:MAG: class I SAM-dependent methyltransferase [Thermodesulfobacteriota bacterium]|nr:class I SAM-dependent methyltransferase [Thermodesulfobacteriota bacterium]